MNDFGTLVNYITDEDIRLATEDEQTASIEASMGFGTEGGGGFGVIEVDGVECYVED